MPVVQDADVAFDAFLIAFLRVYDGWSPGDVDADMVRRAFELAGVDPPGTTPSSSDSSFMFKFSRLGTSGRGKKTSTEDKDKADEGQSDKGFASYIYKN